MCAWSRTVDNVGLVEIKWNWAISVQKKAKLLIFSKYWIYTTVGYIKHVKPFIIQMSIKLSYHTLIFSYFLVKANIYILEGGFLEKN